MTRPRYPQSRVLIDIAEASLNATTDFSVDEERETFISALPVGRQGGCPRLTKGVYATT